MVRPARPLPPGDPFVAVTAKLRKLLAKAESTDVAAEAEAFTAKAQELMARWQIDEALLAEAEGRPASRITSVTIPLRAPHAARRAGLVHAVSVANRCEAVQVREARVASGTAAVIVGDERDVDWVVTLFSSLDHQLDAALRRARLARPRDESPKAWATAFVAGFISVMHRRLREVAEAAVRAAEAEEATAADPGCQPPSVALVLAARTDEVRAEVRRQFPHLRTVRRSRGTSASGRRAGAQAGERATLARGAAGPSRLTPLPVRT